MSQYLPHSMKEAHNENAEVRQRSFFKVLAQTLVNSNMKCEKKKCSTGRFLGLLMIGSLSYLMLAHASPDHSISDELAKDNFSKERNGLIMDGSRFGRFRKKPRRLPLRLSLNEILYSNISNHEPRKLNKWRSRQRKVKKAFVHAWSGYKNYAMGYDELFSLSHRGVDGLGGLGATVVDALDTAMIMGLEEIIYEAGSWIERHLLERINHKDQVNLFETTIRVLGGLLSAYHLSGEEQWGNSTHKGPEPVVYLENARNLADRLLNAFTSSPTPIPYSDVILRDNSSLSVGLSSTSEVSTLQLEFNYLSFLTGDPKYSLESMKVLEHMKNLPKVEGLVPIYICPDSGEFIGDNIRLGSRGDSYYEYLIKVWLQNRASNWTYLYDMYEEAMKGVKHLLVQKSMPNGLVCFLPGALALGATKSITKAKAVKHNFLTYEDLENLKLAEDLVKTCFEMYSVTSTGLAPEIAYFNVKGNEGGLDGGNKSSQYVKDIIIQVADRHNLLRPETVESLFFLYRITGDPKYREWGWEIFKAFEKYTKVESGGYSSLDDVTVLPPRKRDKDGILFLG